MQHGACPRPFPAPTSPRTGRTLRLLSAVASASRSSAPRSCVRPPGRPSRCLSRTKRLTTEEERDVVVAPYGSVDRAPDTIRPRLYQEFFDDNRGEPSTDSGISSPSILTDIFPWHVGTMETFYGRACKRGTMPDWRARVDRASDEVDRRGFPRSANTLAATATERALRHLVSGVRAHGRKRCPPGTRSLRRTRESIQVTTSRKGLRVPLSSVSA